METNIFMELFILTLIGTSIFNCQKRIKQGVAWAFHTSILLSVLLIIVSVFMMVIFTKAAQANCNYIDISALILWGIVFIGASYNLFTTRKIDITTTEVIEHPLIGKNKKHTFRSALHYTIINKHDQHYAWKEIVIFFQKRKVHISSFQRKDYADIHNQLVSHGIPEHQSEGLQQPIKQFS
jgi:hypothetical protein